MLGGRLVALAALLVPASALVGPAALAAPGQTSDAAADVRVTAVVPAAPALGEDVELRGTVVNTGTEPVAEAQVLLRLSRNPLDTLDDVSGVLADPQRGIRYQIAGELARTELAPGEVTTFALPVSTEDLGLTTPGVYVMGADLRVAGQGGVVASDLTLVPYAIPAERPLPVALLWPLAQPPTLLPDGTLVDDRAAQEAAPGGRLSGLVAAGVAASDRRLPVTWLLDPDVVATLDVLADAEPAAGTAADDATALLTELSRELSAASGRRVLLPLADPDVTGLSRVEGGPTVVATSVDEGRRVAAEIVAAGSAGGGAPPVAAAPFRGRLDGVGRRALADAGAAYVLVTEDAAAVTAAGEGEPLDVETDDAVRRAIADTDESAPAAAQDLRLRQQVLADLALSALADPSTPRLLLPALRWNPTTGQREAVLAAWSAPAWVRPVGWDDALAGQAGAPPATPPAAAATPALPGPALTRAVTLATGTDALDSVLDEPTPTLELLTGTPARAASTAWRNLRAPAASYAAASTTVLREESARVRLLVPERVTLSGDDGRFPLTVENAQPVPVTVDVVVEPVRSDLLRVAAVPRVSVGAGEKATVTVTAAAARDGVVEVRAFLRAPSGDTIGAPQSLAIVATDYGRVGWAVIVGAGSVLLVVASLRTARRIRSARR